MEREHYRPGPAGPAERRPAPDGRWTLLLVRDLGHPLETVWSALTDPDRLRDWAPYTADRDLGSPGDAVLTMIDDEHSEDLPSSVLRARPPTLLEHTWGPDLLRWELAPTATGTRLTLRHTMKDPDQVPRVAAGWHVCLDVARLALDGTPIGPIRGRQAMDFGWPELAEGYARSMDRIEPPPAG